MGRLIVDTDYMRMTATIYIEEQTSNGIVLLGQDEKGIVAQPINQNECLNEDLKPLLKLPIGVWDKLQEMIVEHASGQGKRTVNENHLSGKVEVMTEQINNSNKVNNKLLELLDKVITK